MTASRRSRSLSAAATAVAACAASLLFGSIVLADSPFEGGVSGGDHHRGRMDLPLLWGTALPPENLSVAVPGNCQGSIDLTLRWDEEEDYVKARLKGKHVLVPHPNVLRTPGVNFFPNPFWPEAEDILGGRYQLWIISQSEEIHFYYDFATQNLLGTELDFPTQPPGSFAVSVPTTKVVGSDFFQPDADGDVDVEFTWNYSGMVRLDRPELAHMIVSYPAHNACEFIPFRYDLSTTRGYISEPRPASEARPFSAYLRNGLIFQITVEPPQYPVEPPRDTQTATYGNATAFGGLIPPGYHVDIDAVFMNLAPGVKPAPWAGQCENVFTGVHTKGLNRCNP